MPDYRLYNFVDGHIWSAEIITALDDATALSVAGRVASGRHAELWRGAAMLGTFNAPAEPERHRNS